MMEDYINKARGIAGRAHKLQSYGPYPYDYHIRSVLLEFPNLFPGEPSMYEKATILLHDVVEDTYITLEYLSEQGIPDAVVASVDCITKLKGESLESYYRRVVSDTVALRVKLADTVANLKLSIKNGDKRVYKYTNQIQRLCELSGWCESDT